MGLQPAIISASRFWFLYVINLFLCIAKSDYWHESLWSLGTGSNRWWCRTQSGDSRTNTPPQTTRLYHIGQCFGHTRCMVSQMLWLWYALIVHIQSLWMVRDYPPLMCWCRATGRWQHTHYLRNCHLGQDGIYSLSSYISYSINTAVAPLVVCSRKFATLLL